MKVPFNDLRRSRESLESDLREAIDEVLSSGHYVLGRQVAAFEEEFADYCGTRFCVGVANGTDALELALRALGAGPGQEVVTAANAGMYATTAILAVGARPRFIDVEQSSMNLAPDLLEGLIRENTAALVVTHLCGQLAELEPILAIAERHGLPVIEDCAHAHGAVRAGRRAGSWGTIGCFSFYPTKNLGALGDGGAITTSDRHLYTLLVQLRQYGWKEKYRAVLPGGRNSRLDEIQAAILRRRLPLLDELNETRRQLASAYRRELHGSPLALPAATGSDFVAHLYVVRHPRRDALAQHLERRGVSTAIHYPVPDHLQAVLGGRHQTATRLPATERLAEEILSLPLFPGMVREELDFVVSEIQEFFSAALIHAD